jgi:signal transduction histidine kinase
VDLSRYPAVHRTIALTPHSHAAAQALRNNLQSVFEGGSHARRNAVLLFLVTVAPAAIALTGILAGTDGLPVTSVRVAALAAAICWLRAHRRVRFREWAALLAGASAVNAAAQLAAGPNHTIVAELNSLCLFALICVAFETPLVIFAGALFASALAAVQFHFFSPGPAATVTLEYVIVIIVMGAVVHGTAVFLRDALRRTSELHAQMARAAVQERARIATALHDDTIQVLTAASVRLDALAREVRPGSRATASDVGDLVRHALESTRRLSFDLYPSQLDREGLCPALEALARQIESDSPVKLSVRVSSERFPTRIEQVTYRTVKELLSNVSKHAQADHATVEIQRRVDTVSCVVSDDGRGFDEKARADARRACHIGLDAAVERARSAGGNLELTSELGHGTRALLTLPIGTPDSGSSDTTE